MADGVPTVRLHNEPDVSGPVYWPAAHPSRCT